MSILIVVNAVKTTHHIPSVILVGVLKVVAIYNAEDIAVFDILSVASSPALLSILGAHLLFSMKDAGAKGLNQGTSCDLKTTMSSINFAAAPLTSTVC